MNSSVKHIQIKKRIIFIISLLFLNSCSEKHNAATQVIAKVNDNEITVSEFNSQFNQTASAPTASSNKKAVLDELIQINLFASEALKLQLNRSPDAVQRIEIAKKKVFADMYIESAAGITNIANQADIQHFIINHPAIFKPHTAVNLEIAAINQTLSYDQVEKLKLFSNDFQGLKNFLQSANIAHSIRHRTVGIEDLHSDFYLQNTTPKPGSTIVQTSSNRLSFVGITSMYEEPLSEEESSEIALKLLMADKRKQVIEKEKKRLKLISNIEIMNHNFEQ